MKSFKKTYIINENVNGINGFVILKPEFLNHKENFLKMLSNNGWQIIQKNERTLSLEEAKELYKMHSKKDFYNDLCKYMSSSNCLCCSCHKDCKDPIKEMNDLKDKVRKTWGKDEMKNGMHSSDSLENVNRESKLIFEKKFTEEMDIKVTTEPDTFVDLFDNVKFLDEPQQPISKVQSKCVELGISMNDEEFEKLKFMLSNALAEEFNAWYAYTIIIPFLYGPLRPDVVEFFKETAKDELEDHAYWLMERLNQLGVELSNVSDPAFWNTVATHKYIYPTNDTLGAIQNNIKAEQGAIETYTKLEEFTRDKDVVTNCKIKEILKDEQEHLSDLYDLRKDITNF